MEINIDGKYFLCSDSHQWTTKRYVGKDKHGNNKYKTLGYYKDPGNAIKSLANLEIRLSEATTFEEALNKVQEIEAKYNNLLEATNI